LSFRALPVEQQRKDKRVEIHAKYLLNVGRSELISIATQLRG
jgi:hypothetical protein